MDHTPTPFSRVLDSGIQDSDGNVIASLHNLKGGDDAIVMGEVEFAERLAFIVRACNSHEALLAALQTAHAGLCEASAFIPDSCMGAVASCDRAIATVNTALQSARGGA